MEENGKNYQYVLKLSAQNPVEHELIQAIRGRDRLEYPTVKLFILKKILKSNGNSLAESQRINELEQNQQQIRELIGQIVGEIEALKRGTSLKDGRKPQEEDVRQRIKEQTEETGKMEASYEINDLDDDFAADFLKNYNI